MECFNGACAAFPGVMGVKGVIGIFPAAVVGSSAVRRPTAPKPRPNFSPHLLSQQEAAFQCCEELKRSWRMERGDADTCKIALQLSHVGARCSLALDRQ